MNWSDLNYIEMIGFAAATLSTAAFIPQVIKTYRSKSAKDLSLGMFLIFTSGIILWLIYSLLINKYPMILANTITLLLSFTLLYFKLTFKK